MRKPEIDILIGVPPALMLILREFAAGADWADTRRRVRTIVPDLREQSFAFESQNLTQTKRVEPGSLDIHLHGALDLLSGDGCLVPDCRIAAAERLARSVGLIADRAWITDHLS